MAENTRNRSNSNSPSFKFRQRTRQRSRSVPEKVDADGNRAEISRDMLARQLSLSNLADQPAGKIYAYANKTNTERAHRLLGWKDQAGRRNAMIPIEMLEFFSNESVSGNTDNSQFDGLSELWQEIEKIHGSFESEQGVRSQVLMRVSPNERHYAIHRFRQMLTATNDNNAESLIEIMELQITEQEDGDLMMIFQIEKRPRRPETQSIKKKIKNGEVLIKSISRDPKDGRSAHSFTRQMKTLLQKDTDQNVSIEQDLLQNYRWAPFLHNLQNPELARVAMQVSDNDDRDRLLREVGEPAIIKGPPEGKLKYNPRTEKAKLLKKKAVTENIYHYTSKTATSLLPDHGKINPYDGQQSITTTGLLFDLHKSDLRDEKYTFEDDAGTDMRWWMLKGGDAPTDSRAQKQTPLNQLNSRNDTTRYNEILAGVKKEGIIGVFYATGAKDDLNKLHGIARRQLLKREMGLTVPLVALNNAKEPEIVSLTEQLAFLNNLLEESKNSDTLEKLFASRKGTVYLWDSDKYVGAEQGYKRQIRQLRNVLEAEISALNSSATDSSAASAVASTTSATTS